MVTFIVGVASGIAFVFVLHAFWQSWDDRRRIRRLTPPLPLSDDPRPWYDRGDRTV